ncbi:MAG: hypothetical protein WCO03_02355 [bacterium]
MTLTRSQIIKKFGLSKKEVQILGKLNTPQKIQDFLNSKPFNFERKGETYMSPRRSLVAGKCHCLEGALIAALALWLAGEQPLLMDLKTCDGDDHVVTLFKKHGCWGAISKTNHAILRYREPIYKTLRELALSYFHEYFDNETGRKILRSYSKPFDLSKLKKDWVTVPEELFWLAEQLDDLLHVELLSKAMIAGLRPAEPIESRLGEILEWKK